jgi:hypothetical protein
MYVIITILLENITLILVYRPSYPRSTSIQAYGSTSVSEIALLAPIVKLAQIYSTGPVTQQPCELLRWKWG